MRRLQYLDSLRGIAALYVLFFHLALVPPFKPVPPEWLRPVVMFGGSGVTLFFVVSAFSLCMTMPRHEQSGGVLSYYLSRIFRIAPLFYFMIAATYLRDVWEFGVYHSAWKVFMSASFLFNLVPGEQEGFVWASWTIGLEMAFYVVFPLAYARAQGIARKCALLFGALTAHLLLPRVLAFLGMQSPMLETYQHFSLVEILPVFIIGMIAFDLQRLLASLAHARDVGRALIGGGLFGLLGIALGDITPAAPVIGPWHMQGVFYAALLLGLSLCPLKAFVNGLTQFFGTISYSFYLWHASIIYFSSPLYEAIYGLGLPKTVSFLACGGVTIAITTALSYVTYRVIELPGMRLGKRVLARMSPVRSAVVGA